ncbi:MAG: hypothetical protein FJ315_06545 [SAR202 cluster bacterium]|nr:hypothetical protein [SAR202 cluster bacterium]
MSIRIQRSPAGTSKGLLVDELPLDPEVERRAVRDGELGFAKGFLVRDPDGHVMEVRWRSARNSYRAITITYEREEFVRRIRILKTRPPA